MAFSTGYRSFYIFINYLCNYLLNMCLFIYTQLFTLVIAYLSLTNSGHFAIFLPEYLR